MIIIRRIISFIRGTMLKDNYDGEDPWWYEKSYINGYYGDLFVKAGYSRKDLKGFGHWLAVTFGLDLH